MSDKKEYSAEKITVLEGLEAVRKGFDIVELSKKIKKKGDLLILSQELKIKPRSLNLAFEEARILSFFPGIDKSKTNSLFRLKTNRELDKFSKLYEINKLNVRELYNLVKKWNNDLQINPKLLITQEENDLLIGSLLGDASIRQRNRYCCFRFTHSLKQKEYAELKKESLVNFSISEFREVKRKIRNSFIHALDFSTKTHPVFNYYRNLFYKKGRKVVTQEILDQITPRALAFWICDDGSYSRTQHHIILCTNSYTLEEHKLMKKFFNERFGLDPTIGFKDAKYYYLRFRKEDSKKLINIIDSFIPNSMKYKIGEKNE